MKHTNSTIDLPVFVGARPEVMGMRYRIWAPDHHEVCLKIFPESGLEREFTLKREDGGYFTALDANGQAGDLYLYGMNGPNGVEFRPDPASRFQPNGVDGASQCVDSSKYLWRASWARPAWRGQVTYEIHIGTFTQEGTFEAAISKLDHLVELGIEAIEFMPIADFDGDRNWGYDGVALYAPARCYGTPDQLRKLVDEAHLRGIAVILDVVYNHIGPSGSQLNFFSKRYFHTDRSTPWGSSLNFDGPSCGPVRDFFVGNAMYWLDEFRFDGLRLDATHAIHDQSLPHLLADIASGAHARGAFVVAEDDRNNEVLLQDQQEGGYQLDGVWSDDFHHQVRVATTGVTAGYFGSYRGAPEDFAHLLRNGWFYTGQPYPFWDGKPRGSVGSRFPPRAFIHCIENHDQVGNRPLGERLEHLTSTEHFRAATTLLCLSPHAPLIFMGQEWAASSPFLFFTDHKGDLGKMVVEGRIKEMSSVGWKVRVAEIPDPQAPGSFTRSKLKWEERFASPHVQVLSLYQECIAARRKYILPSSSERSSVVVSIVGGIIAVKYLEGEMARALLLVSFGAARLDSLEGFPALHPSGTHRWVPILHTEAPRFGGNELISGTSMGPAENDSSWIQFASPGAVLFQSENSQSCLDRSH